MIIDKEKILEAKEKLGEENAIIIAKELEVQEFDEKNLKGLCPIHNEKTPSFVYNPKSYNFHCFGACSRSYDIIDAFMLKGATYIEAVQKLFALAGIKYSFGEHGVKREHQYKYPNDVVSENKEIVYKYLSTRKISKETVDYAGIMQDENGNVVFRFFDTNDVLLMVKYRPSRKINKGENKVWCQPGADTTPLLFNMNRINIQYPLLICCGECDCLSAIESGYTNATSIPLGDGNLKWIERNWDWLEQFEQIILCADNDESGEKFKKEVVYRLGSWRCKFVDIPEMFEKENGNKVKIKDLNEVLYYFGKEKVLDIIINAKDSPIESLIDFADIDDIDLSDIDGIYTNIAELDKEIMRMFYGSLCLFTGTPGSGKTSFLYQMICHSLDQNKDVWLFSRELPSYMSRNWLNYIFAGNRSIQTFTSSNGTEYYKVFPEAKKQIGEHYRGRLFLYKDGWSNDVEDIKTSMIDSARKNGSKLFILDNLLTINLHSNDENKYDKQTEIINWLIEFSTKYNVCTILITHPRKVMDLNNALTKYDIGGSSNMINLAHRSIGLRRVTKREKEGIKNKRGDGWEVPPNKYDVMVTVIKDRLRGREGFEIGLYYDIPSRRFFSNYKEYEHQFMWDKNVYKDKLQYPIVDEENEVFGVVKNE